MVWIALVLVSSLAMAVTLGGPVVLAAMESRCKSCLGGASGVLGGMMASALVLQSLASSSLMAQDSSADAPSPADRPPAPTIQKEVVAEAISSTDADLPQVEASENAEALIGEGEAVGQAAADASLPLAADSFDAATDPATLDPAPLQSPLFEGAALERPEWIHLDPREESGTFLIPVYSAGANATESRSALDVRIQQAVALYLNDYLDTRDAWRFIQFPAHELRERLVQPDQLVYIDNGTMIEAHALVRIDDGFRKDVDLRWKAAVAQNRLFQTAAGVGAVLLALFAAFGYFSVDSATKGYYSGRLQLALSAGILAVLAGAAWLANRQAVLDWLL